MTTDENKFVLLIVDNKNLLDGGSQIYIVLKAPFHAFQTISIKQNKIHHVQTPSCFQNFIFNLTSESLLWCLIILLFFLRKSSIYCPCSRLNLPRNDNLFYGASPYFTVILTTINLDDSPQILMVQKGAPMVSY